MDERDDTHSLSRTNDMPKSTKNRSNGNSGRKRAAVSSSASRLAPVAASASTAASASASATGSAPLEGLVVPPPYFAALSQLAGFSQPHSLGHPPPVAQIPSSAMAITHAEDLDDRKPASRPTKRAPRKKHDQKNHDKRIMSSDGNATIAASSSGKLQQLTLRKRPPHPVPESTTPTSKLCRVTRSVTRHVENECRSARLEKVLGPVLASGYLRWYEGMRLGCVNRRCRAVWKHEREQPGSSFEWKNLLKELHGLNGTHKCERCEQIVLLKSNRTCCSTEQWTQECAKRKPLFEGVVDILMQSGILTWRERGGIRRISKLTYKVHKEQCTCRLPARRCRPFLSIDPRYTVGYYDKWTDYQRCVAMIRYTSTLVKNLLKFYNFRRITDPNRLPYGLGGWGWYDMQTVSLQRNCPKRYAFVMNLVSLFMAQGELQRSPPIWYGSAFLGTHHTTITAMRWNLSAMHWEQAFPSFAFLPRTKS